MMWLREVMALQHLRTSFKSKKHLVYKALSLLPFVALTFLSLFSLQTAQAAEPDIQNSTCQGANLQFPEGQVSQNECAFEGANPEQKLNNILATIVNLFSVVVGIVAVIMIIYGGFRYITSGGDAGNVSNAKNTILYAILGLVIVALAQFLVKFVLARATGAGT